MACSEKTPFPKDPFFQTRSLVCGADHAIALLALTTGPCQQLWTEPPPFGGPWIWRSRCACCRCWMSGQHWRQHIVGVFSRKPVSNTPEIWTNVMAPFIGRFWTRICVVDAHTRRTASNHCRYSKESRGDGNIPNDGIHTKATSSH